MRDTIIVNFPKTFFFFFSNQIELLMMWRTTKLEFNTLAMWAIMYDPQANNRNEIYVGHLVFVIEHLYAPNIYTHNAHSHLVADTTVCITSKYLMNHKVMWLNLIESECHRWACVYVCEREPVCFQTKLLKRATTNKIVI